MPKQKSAHAKFLTSLGFMPDDEPDELGAGILELLPNLPTVPLVLRIEGDSPQETFIIVVDETGGLWGKVEEAGETNDLSQHGFGNYLDFCGKEGFPLN